MTNQGGDISCLGRDVLAFGPLEAKIWSPSGFLREPLSAGEIIVEFLGGIEGKDVNALRREQALIRVRE